MKTEKVFSHKIGGRELTLSFGALAWQANGAVRARYGDTEVLATAVMGSQPRPGLDYFPLMVDYEEKMYAVGRIKGSRFIKREGRPTDTAILTGRLIDRTLRPLFDQRLRLDVQVVASVVSFDEENDPDMVALNAASAALAVSDIPWAGPVAGVKVARVKGELVINPTYAQVAESDFELVVSGQGELINMIEAGTREVSESDMVAALARAQKEVAALTVFLAKVRAEVGAAKRPIELTSPLSPEQLKQLAQFVTPRAEQFLYQPDNLEGKQQRRAFETALDEYAQKEFGEELMGAAREAAHEIINGIFKRNVLELDRRPDGRALDEVRTLSARVAVLPRPHGSGIFERGMTQALSVVTLGAPGDEQLLDGMEVTGALRFMHHYNFPPFCSGEVKPIRGPGRREIGHGALAEKALQPMIPVETDFPYTIRVVTEILSSNGSTSMAATCASSLALMDAGVPIKKAVGGIAMGLVYNSPERYRILTDIQGPEDHSGDMDFKVAGTADGITAMQLDTKVHGVPLKVLTEAMAQAKSARAKVLAAMNAALAAPRPELSPKAPRVIVLKIDPSKIRSVIGSGGEVINKIIDETKTKIDIEDDGTVFITADNAENGERARQLVDTIVRPLAPGERFQGRVVSTLNFGAFVEVAPGRQGLVHISELADGYVKNVEDVVKVGDVVPVEVVEIDPQGRLNLSRKRALGGKKEGRERRSRLGGLPVRYGH